MYNMIKFLTDSYLLHNLQSKKINAYIKEGQWRLISCLLQNIKPIQKYGLTHQKKKAKDPYQIWPTNQTTESQVNPIKQEREEKTLPAKAPD